MTNLSITICSLFASFLFNFSFAGPSINYKEVARYQLGGDDGWDYLVSDSDAKRLYIARSNRVMILDSETGKQVGEIPGVEGAHGIALVQPLGLGFATAGRAGRLIVFNLKSSAKVGEVTVGENPDAITFDPISEHLFVFNGKSHSASIVDPKSLNVMTTIPLPGKPEFAVSNEAGSVFVNIEDKSTLVKIDVKSNRIKSTFDLTPCEEPTGLSIDLKKQRLFVGCGNNKVVVVSAESGKVTQSFPAGGHIDATAFDSRQGLVFVSAGEGKMTILGETAQGLELLQEPKTESGARTLAVDQKTGRVFLPSAKFGPAEEAPGKVDSAKDATAKEATAKVASSAPSSKHPKPSVIPGSFHVIVMGP